MSRLIALGLLVFAAWSPRAQPGPSPAEGTPYGTRSWTWREYRAHHQNWGVVQDGGGTVYAANSEGLLEFDGETWRLHALPFGTDPTVRSLAITDSGTVYTGGIGAFGVWRPGADGELEYTSLEVLAPEADRAFSDVWSTHVTPRGVVFQSAERLFRWDGKTLESWEPVGRFRPAFRVGGVLVLQDEGVGLRMLAGDGLRSVLGGQAFAERRIDAVVSHPAGPILAVRGEGLVRLEQGRVRPIPGAATDYLRTYRAYAAVSVPDRYGIGEPLFAVATIGGGVAVIAADGRLVRVYREDVGLTEADMVVGLYPDAQGGLWVAHLQGLLRIDLFAPITRFGPANGLQGSVYAVATHEGTTYVGTNVGLYRLAEGRLGRPGGEGGGYAEFRRVEAVGGQTWSLLSTASGLLVATGDGVFETDGTRAVRLTETAAFSLRRVGGRVAVGQADGIGLLAEEGGRWAEAGRIVGVGEEIRFFVTDPDGGVWAGRSGGALFHLDRLDRDPSSVRRFEPEAGLPTGVGPMIRAGDEAWMFPREGAVSVRLVDGRVRVTPVPEVAGVSGVYGLYTLGDEVWISRDRVFRPLGARGADGLQLRGVQVIMAQEDEAGVRWIGTADGLLRIDPRVEAAPAVFPASVRRVTDRGRQTLFAGSSVRAEPFEIPHARSREVRFELAAAFFDAPGEIEYQVRLDGFENVWGAWGTESVAGFTNLWPGAYTLRVRARDARGRLSTEAAFPFQIVPPWYLTWWAYGLYGVGGLGVVWALSTWRLRTHRRKLDAQRARSARLHRLTARLEKTNARLRQADKLKDDLLANTSHELRTPLTAILGFSEMLLDETPPEGRDLAEGIHRGGERLLKTVNGLLDMFKLQSGTMPVRVAEVDAAALVRQSVSLLQPLAQAQRTDLQVFPETLAIRSSLDPDLLDRIVTNLVSNAIKFTEDGRVTVLVDGDAATVRVTVQDTGAGIPEADLDRILEPFEQVSSGFSRTHEGTGLGLSIVSRVLDLVGGDLTFESIVGAGTTVRVTVPREWVGTSSTDGPVRGTHPILEGAYVLCVGLDPASVRAVEATVDRFGTVCAVPTLARALREARTSVFDVVLVAADDAAAEERRVRAIRGVPGYRAASVIRVGGLALADDALADRGFSGALPTPLDPLAMVALFEAALARVEDEGPVPA